MKKNPGTTGRDVLTIRVAADSWQADPQFVVKVGDVEVGRASATAQYGLGQWQDISIRGNFPDSDKVEIDYVNDAWGGDRTSDRNLYIDKITLNGQTVEAEAGINTGGWNHSGLAALYWQASLILSIGAAETVQAAPSPTFGMGTGAELPLGSLVEQQSANVASHSLKYEGVNLAGGEFGCYSPTWQTAGNVLGKDYLYPTLQEIDYFAAKGMNTIRLPFKAVRVNYGDNADDLAAMHKVVDYAQSKGVTVVLDMHDYGYTGTGKLIGHDSGSVTEFAAQWKLVAGEFKSDPNVIFGLMNEPHQQTTPEWLTGANAAIAAIREVGGTQQILVPGGRWDGAHDWVGNTWTQNASVMRGVKDPLNKFAFEVHQYLDSDNSGAHDSVVAGKGATVLKPITDWARANHFQLFLGEFSFAETPEAMTEGKILNDFTHANSDVWIGQTVWAAGPWWGDSPRVVEPLGFHGGLPTPGAAIVDRPQMSVLDDYLVTM